MISSISSNISALNALGKKLGVHSNNIANSGTDEFKKSRAVIESNQNGSVEVEIQRIERHGPIINEMVDDKIVERELSNVDLTEEIPQLISTQRDFEANLKTIETKEEMLGSVLDILG